MEECFSCDYEGTKRGLGSHYGSKPDHRPEITDFQHEVITGLLMGDGHINRSSSTPRLRAEMSNKKYLEYLDSTFPNIGYGVRLSRTAKEQSERHIKTGFNKDASEESYSDCYWWETMCHQGFEEYADWYDSGEKIFPTDLKLTPTVLKHWYCCDGYVRPEGSIVIYLDNESDNRNKIESYFSEIITDKPRWDRNFREGNSFTRIRFTKADSRRLFEYMAEPLPNFEEKWPTERFK